VGLNCLARLQRSHRRAGRYNLLARSESAASMASCAIPAMRGAIAPSFAACLDDATPRAALSASPCAITLYLNSRKALAKAQSDMGIAPFLVEA